MKAYSTKSNANRALKNNMAGLEPFITRSFIIDGPDGFTCHVDLKRAAGGSVFDALTAKGISVKFEPLPDMGEVLAEEKPASKGPNRYIRGASSCMRPCDKVHAVAASMFEDDPKVTRKEIMEACMAVGVTFGTARTQYQAWKAGR